MVVAVADRAPATVQERAAAVVAGCSSYVRHSQRCPVWTRRPAGVLWGDAGAPPTAAELRRCDCWVFRAALAVATELAAAGLLAGEVPGG